MENQTVILISAAVVGFYMAWSIGANDVANAMGTVVGAKTLTVRQAIVVAGIMDCLGAILVGSHVSATIQKGVIDPCLFADNPQELMYGMFAVLSGAATLVTISTSFGMPVSTTHAIVGSMMGFGLVSVGPENVNWGMMIIIASSWLISPLFGAVVSFIVFTIIRLSIFSARNPFEAAKKVGPAFVGVVFFVLSLMIIYKGLKPLRLDFSLGSALLISSGISSAACVTAFFLMRKVQKKGGRYSSVENLVRPMHVLSASTEAFAHGANDVANAIGPLMAIITICQSGCVDSETTPKVWVLMLGGMGIMLGVFTFGYRVMDTLGKKITEMAPSRGFSAEFGCATTVLLASRLGLPVSTTHIAVGNVVGVGLARGMRALNFGILWTIFKAWLITVPASAVLSILIFLLLKELFL